MRKMGNPKIGKLPILHFKDVMKALQKAGFKVVGGTKNHIRMKRERQSKSDCVRIAIIPTKKEVARGTLRSIITQAGMTVEEFLSYL